MQKKTNLIDRNPVQIKLKRSSPQKSHELLVKTKIFSLINYLQNDKENIKLSTMCLAEILTGARISEIKAFRKKNIDTTNHTITIEDQYTITDDCGQQGLAPLKTESAKRLLYIPVALRKNLYSMLEETKDDDFLFLCRSKPYSTGTINAYLETVCDKLKIIKLTTHNLRALYATIALYSNINILTISLQLGHKSIRQTESYLKRICSLDMHNLERIDDFISSSRTIKKKS